MTHPMLRIAAACAFTIGLHAQAPAPPREPVAGTMAWFYQDSKDNFLGAAESMPEEKYDFKPAEGVRTFGQIVGHIADWQFTNCSAAKGETNPNKQTFEMTPTKPAAVAAVKAAYAYCDAVFKTLDLERLSAQGSATPVMFRAMSAIAHPYLHYGNLVTYLRMNGIVPPSTAKRGGR